MSLTDLIASSTATSKIETFSKLSNSNILILTDFDRTLTPNQINGKRVSTSPSRFRDSGILGEEYAHETQALFDHYYPMEIDPDLPIDQKDAVLHEWWTKHLDILVEYPVTIDHFMTIVDQGAPMFRDGVDDFLELTGSHDIPVVICSSGLGDFIRLFLERRGLLDQHIHLFSNLFHFDDAGRAYDYVRPIFHSHSKAHVWERIDDDTSFSSKTHIIVMGDSLGDLTMTHDDRSHTFLTIGFCNDDKHRQVFEEQFDVAVYGDGSFDSITELFGGILEHQSL